MHLQASFVRAQKRNDRGQATLLDNVALVVAGKRQVAQDDGRLLLDDDLVLATGLAAPGIDPGPEEP